jgi:signal transduction histidine kinase
MGDLVRDLLAYARSLEADGTITPVNCTNCLEAALLNLSQPIEQSGARIEISELPAVLAFPAHITQLFQNLISNAVKYRHPDRVPEVQVSSQTNEAGECVIRVRDNGIGIAPEYHDRIFRVFTRLHGQNIAGTGIGLALCKRIAQHYGGRIWVESEAGAGAVFSFTLPTLQ